MTQQQYPHPAPVDELAMLVRRLVQSLRKAAPDNDLADQALVYLKRYGFGGTFLRDVPGDVPAGVKPSKASEAVGTSPSANAPENVPALLAALQDAKAAINSMKAEAETAAQGDEQMMLEACEQISNEALAASQAIDAVLGTCGLHQIAEPPHPMACSAEEVQAFEAAAAPAAVAVPDERAAFEAWVPTVDDHPLTRLGDGYNWHSIQAKWELWKSACAALAAAPAAPAPVVLPEPDAWMATPVMQSGRGAATVFCSDKRMADQWDYGGHPEYGRMLVTGLFTEQQVRALLAGVSAPTVPPASQRDALLQVAIDFIGTLTGMAPPPIEVAPPEVFAPFYAFVERVQAITAPQAQEGEQQ